MPRKPKDIYIRIEEKVQQISVLQAKIKKYELELVQLNKERETLEMKQIFDSAKEHDLSYKQVLEMIASTSNKINNKK